MLLPEHAQELSLAVWGVHTPDKSGDVEEDVVKVEANNPLSRPVVVHLHDVGRCESEMNVMV